MTRTDFLQLVKRYGHYCAQGADADRDDRPGRAKACLEKERELLEQIEEIVLKMPLCTGVSASWCPIHGDCSCKDPGESKNDDDCPLHSGQSNHAEGMVES